MKKRHLVTILSAGMLAAMIVAPASVSATKPDPLHKVTICHRTNSVTNPYVIITVDEASVDGDKGNDRGRGDHLLEHLGPVFDFSADASVVYPAPHNGDQWGDIIPPFYSDGQTPTGYPSLNWNAAGQAIFEAGCDNPGQETTTTSSTTTTTTVDTETSDTTTDATTTTSSVDTETTTPDGSVEELTPPSTDTLAPTGSSTVSTGLLLVFAGLLSLALVATPAIARRRR